MFCRFAREINNLQLKGLIAFVTLCLGGWCIGSTAAALAHCHSVVLASPRAAPGITTRPSGADICLSIDHKGLALDQTDCDRKLLFSPQKRPIACVRVIEWNWDAAPARWAGGHRNSQAGSGTPVSAAVEVAGMALCPLTCIQGHVSNLSAKCNSSIRVVTVTEICLYYNL